MPPDFWDTIFGPNGVAVGAVVLLIILGRIFLRDHAEWKALAQSSQRNVTRLIDLMEDKLDIKVPPAP